MKKSLNSAFAGTAKPTLGERTAGFCIPGAQQTQMKCDEGR